MQFNIILHCTPTSSKCLISIRVSDTFRVHYNLHHHPPTTGHRRISIIRRISVTLLMPNLPHSDIGVSCNTSYRKSHNPQRFFRHGTTVFSLHQQQHLPSVLHSASAHEHRTAAFCVLRSVISDTYPIFKTFFNISLNS
jgi:hypothetical protein